MGIISKGILGGFSGTVGTVIGGSWKGISYMRSQPSARKTSFSLPQLAQQAKFSLMIKFLQAFTGLLVVSFRDFAIRMSGFNSAFRYNIQNAVVGSYPAFELDYSLVLLSRGDLPNALAPAAALTAPGQLTFSWTNNTGVGKAAATDKAMFIVYSPDRNQCIYTTAGTNRSTETGNLDVSTFIGLTVQTYIGFITDDGKSVATSIYTGPVSL